VCGKGKVGESDYLFSNLTKEDELEKIREEKKSGKYEEAKSRRKLLGKGL